MDIRINELLLDGTKFNDFRIDDVESLSCEKGYFIIKRRGGSILSLDAKLHSIANVWPDESDGEADKTLKTVIKGTPDGEKACQEFRTLQALYAFKSLGFEVIKGVLGEEIALNDKKNSMVPHINFQFSKGSRWNASISIFSTCDTEFEAKIVFVKSKNESSYGGGFDVESKDWVSVPATSSENGVSASASWSIVDYHAECKYCFADCQFRHNGVTSNWYSWKDSVSH